MVQTAMATCQREDPCPCWKNPMPLAPMGGCSRTTDEQNGLQGVEPGPKATKPVPWLVQTEPMTSSINNIGFLEKHFNSRPSSTIIGTRLA